ncbi:glycoprotein 96-92, partial [Trypanosoma cruzi]
MLDGETLPSGGQSQVGNAGLSPELRKYHVISAQLESIMGEACREPPSGANCVSIKRRITALQYALEEAERRICEKQRLDDISRKKRVLDVYLRRAKKDEERRDVLEKDVGRRKQLVSEMQEEKRFYYNQKNKEVGGRIEKYKNSILDAQAAVIERAEA